MKRKIITIDEKKCTGCGQCIPDCPEGALQLIGGKARLVSDLFCDGLGACVGTCPEGAISVTEREAGPYDERAVMGKIAPQGAGVIKAHLEHLAGHGQIPYYNQAIEYLIEHDIDIPEHTTPAKSTGAREPRQPEQRLAKPPAMQPVHRPAAGRTGEGTCPAGPHEPHPFAACPGAAARTIPRARPAGPRQPSGGGPSELRQWPIQLALLNPDAAFFDDADLLVAADCTAAAYPGFQNDFLAGKILIIFCPKLDADIDGYIEKLAAIFGRHAIRSVTVLRMEVPCCGGVRYVVDQALAKAGKEIPVTEKIVTIEGGIR